MIWKILAGVVVAIAVVLVLAAMKPATLTIKRSAEMSAPATKVYALLADFHQWPQWAPQDKADPGMTRTYRGAASGAGAATDWHGKGEIGAGSMEIVVATPSHVVMNAVWTRPFAAKNTNDFVLEPTATGTRVTWTWTGDNVFVMKVMGVFVNMDRQMGSHFEAGLQGLKTAAEK